MQERIAWAVMGLAPIVLGLHHLICPALWARPDDDDDGPRDYLGLPVERPHWKVRLIGLGMVAFGLLWIYSILFVKPTDDPVLI
jgi:hypothetical protein